MEFIDRRFDGTLREKKLDTSGSVFLDELPLFGYSGNGVRFKLNMSRGYILFRIFDGKLRSPRTVRVPIRKDIAMSICLFMSDYSDTVYLISREEYEELVYDESTA